MIVQRTFNADFVRSVTAELFDDIAEDGQSLAGFNPDMQGEIWIDAAGALFNFHRLNGITAQIHPLVPKAKRPAKAACIEALKWMVKNTDIQKIVAEIPVIHRHIKLFALSVGFSLEGLNRKSYLKNGVIVDQWLMGITKQEIGCV